MNATIAMGTWPVDQQRGTVSAVDRDGHTQSLDISRECHWDTAYVSTVHAAQGMTVTRTIYHADSDQISTNKEAWYVALSRAREEVKVYTNDACHCGSQCGKVEGSRAPSKRLSGMVPETARAVTRILQRPTVQEAVRRELLS